MVGLSGPRPLPRFTSGMSCLRIWCTVLFHHAWVVVVGVLLGVVLFCLEGFQFLVVVMGYSFVYVGGR